MVHFNNTGQQKEKRKLVIKAEINFSIKTDPETLTNYSITARNYGIHTAGSMYAIRKHGCHDLANKSAKCCTCTPIQQEVISLTEVYLCSGNHYKTQQVLFTNKKNRHEGPAWNGHRGGHSRHPELKEREVLQSQFSEP